MTIPEGKPSNTPPDFEQTCVDTIRTLSIDAVQKANSGHPGLPMGAADFAYVLYTQFLKADPANPDWMDRDRFVLSAGHGSMLLYSVLHLMGYDLPLDEIKNFRQLGSKTPGHPEYGITSGVEATTGPLGQGISSAVGMAITETWLADQFNTADNTVIDHHTYVLASDGDLQEGVCAEAVSLAGHLALNKLVVFYDNNHISIEGETSLSYSDDVKKRFQGYHWNVLEIDGNDRNAIADALETARKTTNAPTIIIGTTTIGFGSPNLAGTAKTHGSPLGDDEVAATKKNLGWDPDKKFFIPEGVKEHYEDSAKSGRKAHDEWKDRFAAMRKNSDLATLWDTCMSRDLPADLASKLPEFEAGSKLATRASSGKTLTELMKAIPNLLGGSADLAPSNNTFNPEHGSYSATERGGRNFHFGIREHAMGAILNGMCYHGGARPFGATFLTFSDYVRPAIRIAALSHLDPIYVFTHDSIYLGEDGPTHQSIEHAAALRSIINLTVLRPGDAAEARESWVAALKNTTGPTALLLTRQGLETIDREKCASADGTHKGAYVLCGEGDLTLIATGSELGTALDVHKLLKEKGTASRVVSMPSWELFEKQDATYQAEVLGGPKRVAIEVGVRQGWDRWIGSGGIFVGMDTYGESAPAGDLEKHFGMTPEQIVNDRILPWLNG